MRLVEEVWREREAAHIGRAQAMSAGHLQRRATGEQHPVEDFLWNYYRLNPAHLQRWHPGAGVILQGAASDEVNDPPRRQWKYYVEEAGDLRVEVGAFLADRQRTVNYVRELVGATLGRPARFGCFGMHEWAMVYRSGEQGVRHRGLPLRLPAEQVDAVVESAQLGCTHFDAFRFFTPPAQPLNATKLERETQVEMEQPGCLHAGMDLYKWGYKLGPIVPGELLLDAFELARDIREVDMQASPYDVSQYRGANGELLTPIEVDTPAGKREYVARQRVFTERANEIRGRLLRALADLGELAAAHATGLNS